MLCALLALASKETALVLPVGLLAYDWLLRPGDDERRIGPAVASDGPAVRLFYGGGGVPLSTLQVSGAGVSAAVLNAETQAIVIWRYIGLLLWPADQAIMHSVHRVTSFGDPLALTAAAGLGLILAGALWMRRAYPAFAFGVVWFFVVLAPSSSVIPLREGMAEHSVYLASAGFFISLAAMLRVWWQRMSVPRWATRASGPASRCDPYPADRSA